LDETVSGVNLVLNLGVVDPGKKSRIFHANFRKISIFMAIYNFPIFQSKIAHFQPTSGQIILFLFQSHHFRTYFLYMIR